MREAFLKCARDWTCLPAGRFEPARHSPKPLKKEAKQLLRFVPETGFEPARRFQRHHLKVVRLPISPPGRGC